MKRMLLTVLSSGGRLAVGALADASAEPSPDEAAIRKRVTAYVEAFNKHDAKALADFWSPDAVYLNRVTGEEVVGREAIAQQFTDLFKDEPEAKNDVPDRIGRVRLAQRGRRARHFDDDVSKGEPDDTAYAPSMRGSRDGKWLLDRVTDEANPDKDFTTNTSNRWNG